MVILAAGLNGCAAVRQQLGTALIPPRTEMELGARMADQISQMQTLHPDPALQKYVREVAAPLASRRRRKKVRWCTTLHGREQVHRFSGEAP